MAKRNTSLQVIESRQELSPQQQTAIELLVTGKAKGDVARLTEVDPYTISRWFKTAEFVAALNARRKDIFDGNAERLRSLSTQALDVLEQALGSADFSVRLKAAGIILKAVKLAALTVPSGEIDARKIEHQWREDELFIALTSLG